MSDIHGAAAPESSPAPVSEVAVELPNPITTEVQPEAKAEKAEPKAELKSDKPISAREALEKAALKVEKDNPKVEAKDAKAEPVKTEPAKRDETGKFAPKDVPKDKDAEQNKLLNWAKTQTGEDKAKPSYTAADPPSRFTAEAKAKWAETSNEVRGEVSRMEQEFAQGYAKHKARAERDATLDEFHDMAKQSGKDLPSVVREYINMENHLRKDLVGGLDYICQKMGVSFRDVAAHVMGQTPEQNASKQDATIRDLNAKIDRLEGQVGNVANTFQKHQQTTTQGEVEKFAASGGHERFEELAEDIAFFLKTRCPGNLPEAYKLAERLNPAPAKAPDPVPAKDTVVDLSVQTEKGQKSINGSPSPGSNPAAQKPSNSIKEALRRAAAQV